MKFLHLLGSAVLLLLPLTAGSIRKAAPAQKDYVFQEGDIVFQGNAGPQSDAVRAATDSPYTHCGVVFRKEGTWWVMEAIHPVQVTRLRDFIDRSLPGTFHAMRLKSPLDPASARHARSWATGQTGRPYDLKFRWDDEALYCSEFVWKLYDKAGVQLCKTRSFQSYDLEDPVVRKIIDQRYGGIDRLPMKEPVVAPSDLAASTLLVEAPRRAGKKH